MPRISRSAPVDVVVIGVGTRGGFHAETIADLKQAALIDVVDPAETMAKATAQRLGCRAFADAIKRSLATGKPIALS